MGGNRRAGFRRTGLVIVDDFDFVRMLFLPSKTYSILLIDPDAVLAPPVALERFQPIARGIP
jgi:hypothetical protein